MNVAGFIFVVVEVLRDTTWCISATGFRNSRTLASFSYSVTLIVFDEVRISYLWGRKSDVTILQHTC